MTNILVPVPWTRINDSWIEDASIDASLPQHSFRDPLISPRINARGRERFQPDHFRHIACDIVAESTFDYPYAYVSEKTLRPMACRRMFIVLGSPGILALLHQKGFQTFGDFVDESYDLMPDPHDRFHAVVQQIRHLCARPLSEILQYLQHNQDRLDHNFHTLQQLEHREIQSILEHND